jgi:hypothetical protein
MSSDPGRAAPADTASIPALAPAGAGALPVPCRLGELELRVDPGLPWTPHVWAQVGNWGDGRGAGALAALEGAGP